MSGPIANLAEVLSGIVRGDESAFNRFYEAYYDRVYRHVFVRTAYDEHATKDVVQQVMLKVVKHIKPVNSEGELWTWLAMVCRSILADFFRDRARRGETELDENAAAAELAAVDQPRELFFALEQALPALAEQERELVDAYYFRNLSQAGLAERYGCTAKAIELRLARIRAKLKSLIMGNLRDGQA